MGTLGTTAPGKRGSRNETPQNHFTAIAGRVKAEFVRVFAWLAVVGGALC